MSDKFRYTAGLNNVGSYQVSGKTFITASTVNDGEEDQIQFPDVTNNIKVKLDSAGGVTKNGYAFNGQFRLADNGTYNYGTNDTYVMWFKRVNPSEASINHFLFRVQGKGEILYRNISSRLHLKHFKTDGSVLEAFSAIGVYNLDDITHLVYTVDHDDSVKVYINGDTTPVMSIDLSDNGDGEVGESGAGILTVGSHAVDMDWGFIELARFNTTFDTSAVTEAYNGGNYLDLTTHSLAGNLIGYWTFGDDPSDTFDNNPSGPGSNLTVVVNDTVGSLNLVQSLEDGDDEIVPFTHTFGGGGGKLRIHYRSKDRPNVISQKHYWTLDSQYESIKMNVKSKELYISADGGNCDYSISAELTNIPTSSMFQHTGSGVDE